MANEENAKLAWKRTIEFLKKHLGKYPERGIHPPLLALRIIRIFLPDLSLGIAIVTARIAPWPVRISINDGKRTGNFSVPEASVCG